MFFFVGPIRDLLSWLKKRKPIFALQNLKFRQISKLPKDIIVVLIFCLSCIYAQSSNSSSPWIISKVVYVSPDQITKNIYLCIMSKHLVFTKIRGVSQISSRHTMYFGTYWKSRGPLIISLCSQKDNTKSQEKHLLSLVWKFW